MTTTSKSATEPKPAATTATNVVLPTTPDRWLGIESRRALGPVCVKRLLAGVGDNPGVGVLHDLVLTGTQRVLIGVPRRY